MAKKKPYSCAKGTCGCLFVYFLLLAVISEGGWKWLIVCAIIAACFFVVKKKANQPAEKIESDMLTDSILSESKEKSFVPKTNRAYINQSLFAKPEVVFQDDLPKEPKESVNFKPNLEITYVNLRGEESVRKIFVRRFEGKALHAYCFLRNEERTFLVSRILNGVDLSTGELISGNIRDYFAENHGNEFKPCDLYDYDEWLEKSYSTFSNLPEDIRSLELNEKLRMTIVFYKEGKRTDEFLCEKVKSSVAKSGLFYVSVVDSKGESLNVDIDKIVSVEGIADFGAYVTEKFYQTVDGKVSKLIKNFYGELSVLVYLGRADTSLTPKRRQIVCGYLNQIGAECPDEVLVKASRKIKLDLAEFKKNVNELSRTIQENRKPIFLAAARDLVGDRAKAKPFGLAGLQYIESKIKDS